MFQERRSEQRTLISSFYVVQGLKNASSCPSGASYGNKQGKTITEHDCDPVSTMIVLASHCEGGLLQLTSSKPHPTRQHSVHLHIVGISAAVARFPVAYTPFVARRNNPAQLREMLMSVGYLSLLAKLPRCQAVQCNVIPP
jgi:hypothetical protein